MLQGLHHLLSDARKGKSLQSLSALKVMANAGVEYMVKKGSNPFSSKNMWARSHGNVAQKNSHRPLSPFNYVKGVRN